MKKKTLLILSSVALGGAVLAGCSNKNDGQYKYTYRTYLASNPKTWNVHNWETSDDSYVIGFTEMGFYDLGFNESKTGFAFINEMASGDPIDVTSELTPEEKEKYFGRRTINLTSGIAYDIPLNEKATWEDGTPINADTYVESMKRLLDPKLINRRADSYYKGTISLANAEGYYKQGNESIEPAYDFITKDNDLNPTDPNFMSDGAWYVNLGGYTPYAAAIFSNVDQSNGNFYTVLNNRGTRGTDAVENAAARIKDAVGKTLIRIQRDENQNSDWKDVEKVDDIKTDKDGTNMWDYAIKETEFDDHPLTVVGGESSTLPDIEDYDWTDLRNDISTFVKGLGSPAAYAGKANSWRLPLFGTYYNDVKVDWDKVGIRKVDDYKIRLIMKQTSQASITDLKFSLTGNWIVKTDLYDRLRGPVAGSTLEATDYGTASPSNYMSYGPYKLQTFQSNRYIEIVKNENWYGWTDGEHEGQFQAERFVTDIITDHKTAMLQFENGKLDDIELDADDMKTYGNSSRVQHTPTSYTQKLSFNVNWTALKTRQDEATDHKGNKTIFTNANFRKAISLSIDRKNFASQCTAGSSGFTGLLNDLYISDIEAGEYYRNTAQGLSVYGKQYAHLGGTTIDEENGEPLKESLVGYNQTLAVEYLKKALAEEKASTKEGHYAEGDKIAINLKVYNQESATTIASYNFLKKAFDEIGAKAGVEFDFWMEQDEDYYNNAKKGAYDTIFSTWGGAQMNPWGLMEVYCDSEFTSNCEYGMNEEVKKINVTFDSDGDGVEETKKMNEWYNLLNESVELSDDGSYESEEEFQKAYEKQHNWRLNVLSNLELAYLNTYSTCPVLSRASSSITSYKVEYGSEKYIPLIGYGGVRYMTFNFTDQEWQAAIDSGEINKDLYRE